MAAQTPQADLRKLQKNYIINGDMRVSQRFAGNTIVSPGNGQYTMDRWLYIKSGAMVHNIVRATDVPTLAQAGYLFQNSLLMTLTTPDTAIAAGDYCAIGQVIEGYNWAFLAQKAFTISFWVKATLPGVYSVGLQNSAADRGFAGEFTIDATNTWEKKTITVPASPVAGTWNYSNGVGLKMWITLAAGTTFQTAPGAWATGTFLGSTNQVNGVNTGATNFWITGVMINEGTEAQSFKLFGEDIEGEIRACRRYFQKTYTLEVAVGTNVLNGAFSGAADAGAVSHHFGTKWFTPEMRTTPTPTSYRISGGAPSGTPFTDSDGVSNPFAIALYDVSARGFSCHISGASGAGATKYCHLTFDAELS